jgi:hypothetical protein
MATEPLGFENLQQIRLMLWCSISFKIPRTGHLSTNPWKLNQFTMESQNGFDFNSTSIQPKMLFLGIPWDKSGQGIIKERLQRTSNKRLSDLEVIAWESLDTEELFGKHIRSGLLNDAVNRALWLKSWKSLTAKIHPGHTWTTWSWCTVSFRKPHSMLDHP